MTVSVAICTFNGEKYIAEQIDSIINQSSPVSEVIICDDQSTDETINILSEIQKKDNRLKIFVNNDRLGVIKNFEKAINLCSGDIIFLSDQDDIWKKNKVGRVKQFFLENNDKSAVFHDMDLSNGNSNLNTTFWESVIFSPSKDFSTFRKYILLFGNVVAGSAFAFRNEKVNFINHPNIYHDYQLALDFSRNNEISYIDECLGLYRIHSGQEVGTSFKPSSSKASLIQNYESDNIGVSELKILFRNYTKFKELNRNISKFDFEEYFLYHSFIKVRRLFLNEQNFLKRKKLLLIWYCRKIYAVKFSDLFTIW